MPLYKDPSGREPARRRLAEVGVTVMIVLVVVGYVIGRWTTGGFDERFVVTLTSDKVGDGLQSGTDVRFRGLRIGRVDEVQVRADGKQYVTLDLDPAQARALTTDVVPVYTASSMFTSTDIEFVPGVQRGRPLSNGQTLGVRSDMSFGTLTSVLNRAGKLTGTLGDPAVVNAILKLTNDSDPYVRLLKETFPVVSQVAKDQKITLTRFLTDAADSIDAIQPAITPMLSVVTTSLDTSGYVDDHVRLRNSNDAILKLSKTVVLPLGNMLHDNNAALTKIIAVALDLGVPTVVSFASFPRAYDRLSTALKGTADAFTTGSDGRTRLNVELILSAAPQIAVPALISKETNPK
ncbi:MlaD family protein [Tsukamurella ocularis]|uniref:MlaD family protein n=1 Tax=Tsukamurella ocularis TaxID=1970234 RepID=UPI002169CFC0|nr:MlaD family protein [Tsukamurella ocularis]MCS3778816.1 hypothetical protein [Tsukamurella ocularis]MCS3787564.1 hypothetical protein [Tsukamurella ocularis]MCS3851499.1 hypothetical protein [Tsukamurella ocularis]